MTMAKRYRQWIGVIVALGGAIALGAIGCGYPSAAPMMETPAVAPGGLAGRHAVVINVPTGPPVIATGTMDDHGRPVTIACATCHASMEANGSARLGKPLAKFHQGLTGLHQQLSCVSCHNPADGYASLRLADGQSVAFTDVIVLCAQCHGQQYKDYQHGAHGGMTGYWDLTRGGRQRNSCVDCHDAHAPAYPLVMPARGPNDRFFSHGATHE